MKIKVLLFVVACAVSNLSFAEVEIPVIPVVNAEQAKANLQPQPVRHEKKTRAIKPYRSQGGDSRDAYKSNITMSQGVTEIVQIAVGHLNRIVTPYEKPVVTSSSSATTEVRDNVVYIGTTSESPLTLFITESGSEEHALSLTLIPKKIPPREIKIMLFGSQNQNIRSTRKAEKWEKQQPYILTIQSLFKTIALGEMPKGYALIPNTQVHKQLCRQRGIKFDFSNGQLIEGHNLKVVVGVAVNLSDAPIEFIEDTCGAWNVAAVAAFPKNILLPGERTEVYVALKTRYEEELVEERPSLLRGGL